jgi:hypothetical protein
MLHSYVQCRAQRGRTAEDYRALNRLSDAEALSRRVIEILLQFTATTSHEHPNLSAAIANYSALLEEMGVRLAQIPNSKELFSRYRCSNGCSGDLQIHSLNSIMHFIMLEKGSFDLFGGLKSFPSLRSTFSVHDVGGVTRGQKFAWAIESALNACEVVMAASFPCPCASPILFLIASR